MEELHFLQSQLGSTSAGPESSNGTTCSGSAVAPQMQTPLSEQQTILQQSHQLLPLQTSKDLLCPEASTLPPLIIPEPEPTSLTDRADLPHYFQEEGDLVPAGSSEAMVEAAPVVPETTSTEVSQDTSARGEDLAPEASIPGGADEI